MVAPGGYQYNFLITAPVPPPGSCRLSVWLQIPAGWKVRKPHVQYSVRGLGTVSTRTAIENGGAGATPPQEVMVGDEHSWGEDTENVWSQTCAEPTSDSILRIDHIVDIDIDVGEFAFAPGDDVLDVLISGGFTYEHNAEWARCGEDTCAVAQAGSEGAVCMVSPKHPCEDNLVCEFWDVDPNRGTCVDPMKPLPPQPTGGICNGVRGIACDGDSVCWFEVAEHESMGMSGVCRPSLAVARERCDGYPEVPCALDTKCVQVGTSKAVPAVQRRVRRALRSRLAMPA